MLNGKKTINILIVIFIVIVILMMCPISCSPTYEALEKAEFTRVEFLSQEIEQYMEKNKQLPQNFEEVAKSSNFENHIRNLLGNDKDSLSDISIKNYMGKNRTLEIVASWKADENSTLVWARTKDGNVIRLRQEVLEGESE
ncbi:MAG: hypothetical protein ISS71_03495 [Phycisphaerae bacterium]|nr:hypothetical protein [Phycisphaerae bacterium]